MSNEKTHGVLTDDALRAEARELSAILVGMVEGGYELETLYTSAQTDGDAFVRRAADMLAVFAAQQSPHVVSHVAPADERAALWGAGPMQYDGDVAGDDDDWIVYEKGGGGVAWSVEKEDAIYIAELHNQARARLATPMPPTSAADAFKQAEITERGDFHLTLRFPSCRLVSVAADAIAASKKESGDE